jgi:hypothetical protein
LGLWIENWSFIPGEVIGYGARAAAYNKTDDLALFVLQAAFTVIAPAFYAASIYMTLGRIIRCVKGDHLSIIRTHWLTRIFVIGDSLSLSVQGGASNLTSNDNPKIAKIGEDIIIAGLFIQLALLAFFFTTTFIFHRRLKKDPTRESYSTKAPWRQTLFMIYTISALIFARSIFRVVEYIQGIDGYSMGHEWTLYTFDAVPMFVVAVAFWIWYPGYIQSASGEFETVDTVELS